MGSSNKVFFSPAMVEPEKKEKLTWMLQIYFGNGYVSVSTIYLVAREPNGKKFPCLVLK